MNALPAADGFRILEFTGLLASSIAGGLAARSARLDPIGFLALALISGMGGGIIRDVLLQHGPPAALTDPVYPMVALAGAALAYLVPVGGRLWDRGQPIVDALALGCWAAVGAQKTLDLGLGWLSAVLLGAVTAVGGGVLRDVLLQRMPAVFGGNTLYATPALVASASTVVLCHLDHPHIAQFCATVLGGGLVLIAHARAWTLPRGGRRAAEEPLQRPFECGRTARDEPASTARPDHLTKGHSS